jgi:lipoprotein-anchoring transpeptidase ErfK/SrfK
MRNLTGTRAVVTAVLALVVALGAGFYMNARPAAVQDNGLRLVLDIGERRLHVYSRGERTDTYRVAVGAEDHETPTGSFHIHKIDWNPDWTPPDSEWAADAEKKAPGEEGNPMGRVRIIYQAPYSIHGTEDLESLGRAESHGSVRMANPDIIELARRVMAAGGEDRSSAWYEEVHNNPTRMYEVELPNPVPLENRP